MQLPQGLICAARVRPAKVRTPCKSLLSCAYLTGRLHLAQDGAAGMMCIDAKDILVCRVELHHPSNYIIHEPAEVDSTLFLNMQRCALMNRTPCPPSHLAMTHILKAHMLCVAYTVTVAYCPFLTKRKVL